MRDHGFKALCTDWLRLEQRNDAKPIEKIVRRCVVVSMCNTADKNEMSTKENLHSHI